MELRKLYKFFYNWIFIKIKLRFKSIRIKKLRGKIGDEKFIGF
jgi:hypothetical protein